MTDPVEPGPAVGVVERMAGTHLGDRLRAVEAIALEEAVAGLIGETLAKRLTAGPLPVRDVLRYAIQIAEALDHAPSS